MNNLNSTYLCFAREFHRAKIHKKLSNFILKIEIRLSFMQGFEIQLIIHEYAKRVVWKSPNFESVEQRLVTKLNKHMVVYFCHHLSDNNVDLSDIYVDFSVIYVDFTDH